MLALLVASQARLVVHNAQFEMGVCRCRFPDMEVPIYADTMRMVQVYDNGGNENDFEIIRLVDEDGIALDDDEDEKTKKVSLSGFGLVKSCKRILGLPDHKDEAYTWLRANGVRKGQEGANLSMLPADVLERYNVGDTEATLELYDHLEACFAADDYDWRFDHGLYMSTVGHLVSAKIRGVRVMREPLSADADKTRVEIEDISATFKTRFAAEIATVERDRLLKRIRKLKKLKGRKKYLKRMRANPAVFQKDIAFNTGSNTQLAALFVGVLGMQPKFFTAKNSPSFKSSLLGQWGDGGMLLQKRRKRLIVLKQAESLFALSAYDGRWHLDVKAAGTSTGRAAGGQH